MKSKEVKSEKIKKRKKKRAKAVQWQEGLKEAEGKEKELKEEKEEECKAQVLNGDRESERERVTCKKDFFFCSARARLLQLCGSVWERQSFRLFNFFLPCTSKP